MNVSPIRKSSATGKVFRALYEMIATGRYTRGQKLPPQEELARQFGVSRNTLREAVNQLAAMGLLARQPCHVVLLDIHMPGSDGLVLARTLAALPRPPAIVFVTAAAADIAQQCDVQSFGVAGAATWTKPDGARLVHLVLHGGGGGGGSGRLRADSATAAGAGRVRGTAFFAYVRDQ